MSMRKSRPHSDDDGSASPHIPSVPQGRGGHSDDEYIRARKSRRRSRYDSTKGYDMGGEKISSKVDFLLSVLDGASSHRWRTARFSFDMRRTDDRELWEDIRQVYLHQLQKAWRRIFMFKKLKRIVPVEVLRPSRLCSVLALAG